MLNRRFQSFISIKTEDNSSNNNYNPMQKANCRNTMKLKSIPKNLSLNVSKIERKSNFFIFNNRRLSANNPKHHSSNQSIYKSFPQMNFKYLNKIIPSFKMKDNSFINQKDHNKISKKQIYPKERIKMPNDFLTINYKISIDETKNNDLMLNQKKTDICSISNNCGRTPCELFKKDISWMKKSSPTAFFIKETRLIKKRKQ